MQHGATLFQPLPVPPSPQVAAAHPAVNIGSYPNTAPGEGRGPGEEPYKVKLAFTSRDGAALEAAVAAARVALRDVLELPAPAHL